MAKLLIGLRSYSTLINVSILIVRIYTSAMMLTHGAPKLMRLLDGDMKFRDPIGLGPELSLILTVFSEFFCSILIIIGLGTRLATIPLLITMVVVLFIVHGSNPISEHLNVVAYIAAYLALFATGSGKYSLDYKFFS
jgi:putative oxidoreductase